MPSHRVRRILQRFAFSTMLGLLAFTAGCGRKKTERTEKSGPQPPKVTTNPDSDLLETAVKKQGGNVEKALQSLIPEREWKSLIARDSNDEIQGLDLSKMSITTAGLKRLVQFKATLQRLSLNDVYVTDDGLKALAALPHLRRLELNRAPVTDAGLAHLSKMTELRELSLKGTRITDDGLKHLAALKNLRYLSLTWTRISDDGLQHISGLTELDTLILDNTKISDAGLEYLTPLKKLRFLHLTETRVTPAGIDRFRQSNPGVKVRGPIIP